MMTPWGGEPPEFMTWPPPEVVVQLFSLAPLSLVFRVPLTEIVPGLTK
jgi:hypothetical protein